ncbi:MAG TPA: sugar phosphate nucleotidyltransferase [Phycisphaerales bacterium]|nr:sugar phosphate nucleotidyltransferase [Phycisphaerales bacterium]
MRYAMIMAGGAGTRLWPMSRNQRPKQLLPLIGDSSSGRPRSLLEIAAARVEGLVPPERRFICTGEQFRAQIREALPQFTDDRILGEPMGRDTVNAVGFAAAVFQKLDKDATFIVLTADHLISPDEVFRERAELAFRLVEEDPKRLVTFSIKPTYAATGFGYVERGSAISVRAAAGSKAPAPGTQHSALAFRVARFVEKPDLPRAQAYFESGHFGWNSGMFVFHAATFMDCLKRFKPESYEGLVRIQKAWGTKDQKKVIDEVYPNLPRISVDYAIMEPASRDREVSVATINTDVQWLDVGSWPSYAETLKADEHDNRTGGTVKSIAVDSSGTLITGESADATRPHTIAVIGVKDLIVVHTRDATLVMPRSHAEQLKKLHGMVPDELK